LLKLPQLSCDCLLDKMRVVAESDPHSLASKLTGWLAFFLFIAGMGLFLGTLAGGAEAFIVLRAVMQNQTEGMDPIPELIDRDGRPWFVGLPIYLVFFPLTIAIFEDWRRERLRNSNHMAQRRREDEDEPLSMREKCKRSFAVSLALCSMLFGAFIGVFIGREEEWAEAVSVITGMFFFFSIAGSFFVILGFLLLFTTLMMLSSAAWTVFMALRRIVTGEDPPMRPRNNRLPNNLYAAMRSHIPNRIFNYRIWSPLDGDDEVQSFPKECAICLSALLPDSDEPFIDENGSAVDLQEGKQRQLAQLPCSYFHVFHAECLEEWLSGVRNPTCPLCKAHVPHRITISL